MLCRKVWCGIVCVSGLARFGLVWFGICSVSCWVVLGCIGLGEFLVQGGITMEDKLPKTKPKPNAAMTEPRDQGIIDLEIQFDNLINDNQDDESIDSRKMSARQDAQLLPATTSSGDKISALDTAESHNPKTLPRHLKETIGVEDVKNENHHVVTNPMDGNDDDDDDRERLVHFTGLPINPPELTIEKTLSKEEERPTMIIELNDTTLIVGEETTTAAALQEETNLVDERNQEEKKDKGEDLSVDTPPIPIEVRSVHNEENSEYDEELEFDASDNSSEGELSSDDGVDYEIETEDLQFEYGAPHRVPSAQDT